MMLREGWGSEPNITVTLFTKIRPDQINCLFHGSGRSIFLAFEKKILIG